MIENIANITYDWNNIENISQDSNVVKVNIYNLILNLCISESDTEVFIKIFNNTGESLYCLKIKDNNNNFIYEKSEIEQKEFINIKYKKTIDPKLLICYLEKTNKQYNKVYIKK